MKKEYTVAIIAHVDAGKTTLTEEFLYESNAISIKGSVDEGTSTTDFFIEEIERGITISSSAVFFTWKECFVTLIDTPGHIDFSPEVEYVLSAVESVILICSGVEGLQTQSRILWEKVKKYSLPAICFINSLDRKEAGFDIVLNELKELHEVPLVCVVPVKEDDIFYGSIDILEECFYALGSTTAQKIPTKYAHIFLKGKENIESILSSIDEKFLTSYLEETLSKEEIYTYIAKHTKTGRILPVIGGSAKYHCAIIPTLNAIIQYLPNTFERDMIELFSENGESSIHEIESLFLGQILKRLIVEEKEYFLFKIFSGSLTLRETLYNTRLKETFQVDEIARLFATQSSAMNSAKRGDIILISFSEKNFLISFGDTFTRGEEYFLIHNTMPQPVVSIALEVTKEEEYVLLDKVLSNLVIQDISLECYTDEITGQRILKGLGELHLLVALDYIRRESSFPVRNSSIRCVCYEKLIGSMKHKYYEIHTHGTRTEKTSCFIHIEPLENKNTIECICEECEACKNILENTIFEGTHGYPLYGIKISILSCTYSDINLFKKVCIHAIKEAINLVGTIVVIPIAKVDIVVPLEYVGVVNHYVAGKGGVIRSIETKEAGKNVENRIEVHMPLSSTFSLSTQLRSLTKGYAMCTIFHSHYE